MLHSANKWDNCSYMYHIVAHCKVSMNKNLIFDNLRHGDVETEMKKTTCILNQLIKLFSVVF